MFDCFHKTKQKKILISNQIFPVVPLYLLPFILYLPFQEEFGSVFSLYSHEVGEDSSKIPLAPT